MTAAAAAIKDRDWPLFRGLRGASLGRFAADATAGLTLAAIAIPEQMATARLGGLPPQLGLFAFVAATVAFAVFGANKLLSAGSDSTITPIFAGSLAGLAAVGSAQYLELAAALALLVGAMVALGGLLRLGWVADLLSRPVTTGFFAGISLHILISQAPVLLGLPAEAGDVYHRLASFWRDAHLASPAAIGVGLGVFAVTLAAEKLSPRIPGALIAVAGATMITVALKLDRHGLPVLGRVSGAFPALSWPGLRGEAAMPLVGLAAVISLVVMVQTAAVTRSFAGEEGDPDVNRDYVGLGAGGVVAGLFGLFPVNASPPRTAAVAASGGRSQVAGLLAAAAVLLLALLGSGLLVHVPSAALAGVLLFVAQRIFRLDEFRMYLMRAPAEFALAALTTALIVLLPIQTGVVIGMFTSLAHGVFTITRARLIRFEQVQGTSVWWPAGDGAGEPPHAQVLVMGFQAPLSFLNAFEFRRAALAAMTRVDGGLKLFVLEASNIVEIDLTAAELLREVIRKAHDLGVDFAISRLESVRAQDAMRRFGVIDELGPDHLFRSVADAIAALDPRSSLKPA
jgi:MFS superfamily sulfate permease-like transporter